MYKYDEALSYVVQIDIIDVVDYLLSNHEYSLNNEYFANDCCDEKYRHQTLLMSACQRKSGKIVELLLEYGADPNMKGCVDKCPSAINIVIAYGHAEMIARLIRGGVDVNTRSICPNIVVVLPFEAAIRRWLTYKAEMLPVYGSSRGVHSLISKHQIKNNLHLDLQKLLNKWEVDKKQCLTSEEEMSDGDPEPFVSSS